MDNEIANVPINEDELREQQKQDNETVEEKRYCKKCKQWLPINHFNKYGPGIRHICKACEHNIKNPSEKFIDFTSRELIEELRRRGYKGKLTYTEITEVKL